MKKTVRRMAVDILNQVQAKKIFAGSLLDEYLDKDELSGSADGRLLTHLVYGVLRFRGHLDWILKEICRGKWDKTEESIKNILRTGLFQLKFSNRLPAFAVVNEAVETAKKMNPAKSGLVNAVLRNYLRHGSNIIFPSGEEKPSEFIASFYSHPRWLVETWLPIFGMETTCAICSADNEIPPLAIRANTLKISRDELMSSFRTAGFDPLPASFSPDGIILNNCPSPVRKTVSFQQGYFRIQDEASQLLSYLACPEGTVSVLDACAGRGGKATHLAAIMHNKGRILALDYDRKKNEELAVDAARLGISIIETGQADLTAPVSESLREKFDSVLVDAPCSGSGTLRRNPEIKWRLQASDLSDLVQTQKAVLRNASLAVKKGGLLIYCTCSLLPQENENIIDDFLIHHPYFSVCPPHSVFLRFIDQRNFFRTFPHLHKTDGFFAALMQRR